MQDVYFRAGEVVNAGQPILAFLPPGNLKIRFFVPEPVLSTLARGQTVTIDCDRCPAGLSAEIAFLSRARPNSRLRSSSPTPNAPSSSSGSRSGER